MSLLTVIVIALAVAMDAFAVSICIGLKTPEVSSRTTLKIASYFGLFQFAMPILGWLAGFSVSRWITAVDHWIAFFLLAAIGVHMIFEAFQDGEEPCPKKDRTRGMSLIVLSVATSIDALAVGLSLALLDIDIRFPALTIGMVTFALTVVGLHLGRRFGTLLGKRVDVLGGVILIAIGFKILFDHVF